MSKEIPPSSPSIQRPPQSELQQADELSKRQAAVDRTTNKQPTTEPGQLLRSTLQKLSAGREYQDDKSFKAFTKLSRSLERIFSDAEKVDREAGERELKQGGLRRVDKDLRKLFKGLGMPPQMAKHFSRGITASLKNEDVEQIGFSLTSARAFNLSLEQQQSAYLASGDGTGLATRTSSLQIAAIQVRSLDVAINLRSGAYSLAYSNLEAMSVSSSETATLASVSSVEVPAAAEQGDENRESLAASQQDVNARIESDSLLQQISRSVRQAVIMRQPPAAEKPTEEEPEAFDAGVTALQTLVERLETYTDEVRSLFEPLVQVNNLRVEKETPEADELLRFNLQAQAPIGLSLVDDNGREATLYPRPTGSIGKIAAEELKVTV